MLEIDQNKAVPPLHYAFFDNDGPFKASITESWMNLGDVRCSMTLHLHAKTCIALRRPSSLSLGMSIARATQQAWRLTSSRGTQILIRDD